MTSNATRTARRDEQDRQLLAVAAGDRSAFSALYAGLFPSTVAIVQRTLLDRAQAEEVTQEVFIHVWTNARAFDPNRGSAAAWILTIARRRAVDRVRAAQADRDRDLTVGSRDYQSPFDSTFEQVASADDSAHLSRAISRLTDLQQEAIRLRYQHGHTTAETAALLRIPLGTLKTRLRAGLTGLHRELTRAA